MKKKLFKILLTFILIFTMMACTNNKANYQHPLSITNYVVDIGTITDFDEEAFMKYYQDKYLVVNGGCSSIVTQIDGNNLVGRNLDMGLSESTAFKFVLDINKYKTIGLVYSQCVDGLDCDITYDNVLKNGIDKNVLNRLLYTASDVLNEKGLYIQTNNRNLEEGTEITGTNPNSKENVFLIAFPSYAATRCATVDEVVKLVESVNLYNNEMVGSNFAFMVADALGDYGLIEVANNQVSFLKGQNGQANFYVTSKFAKEQKYGSGESRYKVLNEGLDKVKSMDDMLEHLRKAHYSQAWSIKDLDKATFDVRSEYVNYIPVNEKGDVDMENGDPANCTTAWLTDDNRKEEVYNLLEDINKNDFGKYLKEDGTYDYEALRKAYGTMPDFWVSAFTIAVDCKQKIMKVRFWENVDETFEFSFK